tara:strand:- start:376 stop:1623 length:1248 start_codon:yes stop_codon:yes gene_type:complete
MKKNVFYLLLILLFQSIVWSQSNEIVKAIDKNAFEIKDVDPNIEIEKSRKLDSIFQDIRVFGFGEATHGTKEFFDLKIKFFKYVVKNHGVKNFAIEASYGNCIAINNYIHGEVGDSKTLLSQIGFWTWNCKEILDLIEWMKAYNLGKNANDQLSFNGIDSTDCTTVAKIIYNYINDSNIQNKEEYLKIIGIYIKVQNIKSTKKNELKLHLAAMNNLKIILKNDTAKNSEFYVRTQEAIIQYIEFGLNYSQTTRDIQMAENVTKILTTSGVQSKVFLWAHNLHVSKDKVQPNSPSMGHHLKDQYKNQYYSVGFDFATGKFNVYSITENRLTTITIDKVMKNTSSETFNNSALDNYLLDFKTAKKTSVLDDFLNSKVMHQGIGSTYSPKMVIEERLANSFDALLFVKKTKESTLLRK